MLAGCFEDEGGVMGVHDFCGVWGENCWVLRVIMPGDDAGDHAQDNSDEAAATGAVAASPFPEKCEHQVGRARRTQVNDSFGPLGRSACAGSSCHLPYCHNTLASTSPMRFRLLKSCFGLLV